MKIDESIIRQVIFQVDESNEARNDDEFVRSVEHIILEMKRLQKIINANKKRNN